VRQIFRATALFIVMGCVALAQTAQTPDQPPKQTARQALIEMFVAKTQEDFVKHLPDDARKILVHKGDTAEASWALRFADIGKQLTRLSGGHLETFDEGPIILAVQQNGGSEKFEATVEHDSLMGEADEIEVSIQYSKDGQPVPLAVLPRLTFTLQQQKEIWRLTELTAAAHVPLTDPDYLKGLRKQQDESNEEVIQTRVTMIVSEENAYAAKRADHSYTCAMASLFTPDAAEGQAEGAAAGVSAQPLEIDSVPNPQPNEEWNGYRFTLSGCEGSPAMKFRVLAAPADPDAEIKTFCADQSGTVKFITTGKHSTCFREGEPVNPDPRRGGIVD